MSIGTDQDAYDYPRGWFLIGGSEDFIAAEVYPLRYFGQDLVAFRTESQGVVVLDAYCPHLGAHLGHGGKVEGETIVCPFHAWRFDQGGVCVEIPYAKRIPDRACTRSWLTQEHSGMVMIWHDPAGGLPDYQVPVMLEFDMPGWTRWNLQRLEIKTQPREIIENVADSAHFEVVHQVEQLLSFDNQFEDHTATQIMVSKVPGGSVRSEACYYGPAIQYTSMTAAFDSRLLNANTPIDQERVHLWFGVMMQTDNFSEADARRIHKALVHFGFGDVGGEQSEHLSVVHQGIMQASQKGYYDDVAIWENKLYRSEPILCDSDGPLARLRRWYGQFYRPID